MPLLSQSPPAKPSPPRPGQAFVSLHRGLGVPLPPPAARWLRPPCPGCHRQEGTQGQHWTVPSMEMLSLAPTLFLGCPSSAREPLGLLWVIPLLKERRDVALWLSQARAVPHRGLAVLTAPCPCPQGQQGGSLRWNHRHRQEHPGQSRWSGSTCPGGAACARPQTPLGAAVPLNGQEMVKKSWKIEAEPTHSWFFW